MEIIIIIYLVAFLIALFFLFRNNYIYKCRRKIIDIIYNYHKNNEYVPNIYEKMMISYNKHMFSIWKWGKYSGIKDEYKEILKPYMN